MTCVFCEIVAGREPSSVVYEDEHVLALLDPAPATQHHTLVIPKAHAAGLGDLTPESAAAMMPAAQAVALAIRAFDPSVEGISLWLADGSAAGQDVFHAHLHVVPRKPGDGVEVDWPYGSPSREELDDAAASLRSVFETAMPPTAHRLGDRPETSKQGPHRQLTQNSSPQMWGLMAVRLFQLPGVTEGHSSVSLPTSRALLLDTSEANGPEEAFLGGTEFAHLHDVFDTSLHLCLPIPRAREICELGWGEPHGYAEQGTEIMVYAPRNEEEIELVIAIVTESLNFARG